MREPKANKQFVLPCTRRRRKLPPSPGESALAAWRADQRRHAAALRAQKRRPRLVLDSDIEPVLDLRSEVDTVPPGPTRSDAAVRADLLKAAEYLLGPAAAAEEVRRALGAIDSRPIDPDLVQYYLVVTLVGDPVRGRIAHLRQSLKLPRKQLKRAFADPATCEYYLAAATVLQALGHTSYALIKAELLRRGIFLLDQGDRLRQLAQYSRELEANQTLANFDLEQAVNQVLSAQARAA